MITQKEYIASLCHANPDKPYAKLFGYKEFKNGTYSFTKKLDFTKFGAEPNIANEFISDFYNKIVVQYSINLFEKNPLDEHFSAFLRTYGKVGDIEEYIASKLKSIIDYDSDTAPTNPFEVSKPEMVLSFIQTVDKQLDFVTLNYEQWYGAFVNANGLDNLANQIISQLKTSIDMDLYFNICKVLGDTTVFTKTKSLTKITGVGDETNAKKSYEEIIQLVNAIQLPSKTGEYNSSNLENSGTPKKYIKIFLNKTYASSYAINVLASLFHSEKIEYEWDIIDFDSTQSDVIGVVMDMRAYVYGFRINMSQSIYNPRNMCINTFYHRWTKRGAVPFYNAIVLKETA